MSLLIKNIAFPLHEFLKGHRSVSYLRSMEQSQWYSPERLSLMQTEKLKHLLSHAYNHVPYYRALFSSELIAPDDIKTVSDLGKLPFLTKNIIRRHIETLKSETSKNLKRFNTGGSTGEPLQFYLSKRRIGYDTAAKLRAARWWGINMGDPEVVVWGSPVELTKQDMVRKMRDRLFKSCLLSAFDMGENRMDEYLAKIKKFRPKHIFGYPSSIYMLSKYAEQKNISLRGLGVKVVFCTAEKLYEYQRLLISDFFNAPVANGYGGRDTGFIAHECPETSGLHITAENIIIEIIDQEGNPLPAGHRGEIIITNLDTHDFPFIRYRTGDIGVLSGEICSCGRGLPLLKDIEGRSTDFIVTSDKKIMHGLSLIYVLREIHGIEEFRIVQEEVDLFSVSIVKNSSFISENEETIRKGFKDRIGSDVKIRFNYQQKIEPEKSGKFRYVVSKVPQPYSV